VEARVKKKKKLKQVNETERGATGDMEGEIKGRW
jgi:hypothetical protein